MVGDGIAWGWKGQFLGKWFVAPQREYSQQIHIVANGLCDEYPSIRKGLHDSARVLEWTSHEWINQNCYNYKANWGSWCVTWWATNAPEFCERSGGRGCWYGIAAGWGESAEVVHTGVRIEKIEEAWRLQDNTRECSVKNPCLWLENNCIAHMF